MIDLISQSRYFLIEVDGKKYVRKIKGCEKNILFSIASISPCPVPAQVLVDWFSKAGLKEERDDYDMRFKTFSKKIGTGANDLVDLLTKGVPLTRWTIAERSSVVYRSSRTIINRLRGIGVLTDKFTINPNALLIHPEEMPVVTAKAVTKANNDFDFI